MIFLRPDARVPCEVRRGEQDNRETLEATYKGKSIADVLAMTTDERVGFFEGHSIVSGHLRTLAEVGMGYVQLGRPATTRPGGEESRLELTTEPQKRTRGPRAGAVGPCTPEQVAARPRAHTGRFPRRLLLDGREAEA